MQITLSIVAFAIILVLFAVLAIKSRKEISSANEDRRQIYRNCFLRGLSGVLAKMAAADGCVSLDEEAVATRLFKNMGLSDDDRRLCCETFAQANRDTMPGGYYASLFVPYSTKESRVLVYEVLWDIAAADGEFAAGEEKFLRELLSWLELDPKMFDENLKSHARKFERIEDAVESAAKRLESAFN